MRTFIEYIPPHYRPIKYKFHRPDYHLFFDYKEKQYHIYRRNDQPIMFGWFVHLDSFPSISANFYQHFKARDLSRNATKTVDQIIDQALTDLMAISPAEQAWIKNQVEIQHELNKEYTRYIQKGLTSFILGSQGPSSRNRKKQKKYIFVNTKTGQKTRTMPKEVKEFISNAPLIR